MTYFELVEKVRTALVVKADASKIEEHIAVQVNVTGEAAGAFYIEIKDGKLVVEPFTYNDRDFQLTGEGADILSVALGKKTLEAAVTEGVIAHEGNWDKTLVLSNIIPPAKKTSSKKTKKEEPKADAPEEGQIALVEEASKTEEAPKEEPKAKKTTKSSSSTKTKSTSKTKEAPKTKTTRKSKESK